MKKTLIITMDYPPALGGVASYWQKVTASLPADKVVILSDLPFFRFFYPKWLKSCFKIWRVYRDNQCQQIWADQVLPVGASVYLLHWFFKIPYFIQVHGKDLLTAKIKPRKYYLAKKVLKNAKLVFCNSQATAQILKEAYQVTNYQVIYPQSSLTNVAKPQIITALKNQYNLHGKKILLTVGRLIERKGQDMVIQSLSEIIARRPDLTYVIVGDGPDKQRLLNLAKGLEDNIIFVGSVSAAEQLAAWYEIADVFIMPARQTTDDVEGLGIVYLGINNKFKTMLITITIARLYMLRFCCPKADNKAPKGNSMNPIYSGRGFR